MSPCVRASFFGRIIDLRIICIQADMLIQDGDDLALGS